MVKNTWLLLFLLVYFSCTCKKETYRNYQEVSMASSPALVTSTNFPGVMKDKFPSSLSYIVPKEWREVPSTNAMVKTVFVTKSNSRITLAAFPGDVGDLSANVRRWARQIKLEEAKAAAQVLGNVLSREGKRKYVYVSFLPLTSSAEKSILAGIYRFKDQTLFVKLTGYHQQVILEEKTFISFLDSIQ